MAVPMLNEVEFAIARELYRKGFRNKPDTSEMNARFNELLEYYNKLTGFNETSANAIMHHRVENYGADCPNCCKPLRTKLARYCVECGFGKEDFENQETKPLMVRRAELFNKE